MHRADDESARAPADEVELWWGGYSGWAMLPLFFVCACVTAAMIGSAWYLYSEENVPGDRARYAVYLLALALWSMVIAVGLYRMVSWNYRLTTRRLFLIRGINPRTAAVTPLGDIQCILVSQTPVERRLNIGSVRVQASRLEMDLPGVRDPHHVAGLIEKQVKRVRE